MNTKSSSTSENGIAIVLCGQAGQGIQTVEHLLTRIFKLAGFNVFATKEYMSRVRGGMNSTQIRVSSKPVRASVKRIDILIPLDKGAVRHLKERISSDTVILAEKEIMGEDFGRPGCKFVDVPFTKTASEIGNKIYSNVVAVGTIAGLFGIEPEPANRYTKEFFSAKSGDIVQKNLEAIEKGYSLGTNLIDSLENKFDIRNSDALKDQILVSGTEAVALGAIAGGCNFISAYPMSPSTGVLTFLAKHAGDFGIIAEQAEDEIAAINMAVGAWYAGARAMVTTSGGGFALMTEGLSLAGMLESPLVIHLAQRPGPATGLPTRTEQADLELALYAGHGEFPRIIFAPGTLDDAFYLAQKAFNLADKYQVPAFILTDQYLVDSYYNCPAFDIANLRVNKHIVKTSGDYKRYALTGSGISPRGVPGFGEGLVSVDSDEHDEAGHITEDLDLRIQMVDKRLRKLENLNDDTIQPVLIGPEDYKNLVVCWGSNRNIVDEALKNLDRDDTALLHFSQIYPLPGQASEYLQKAQNIIMVENNATSQFVKLIRARTGIDIDNKVLKYNGLSFFVEELTDKLSSLLI